MPRSASPKDIITTLNRVRASIASQHAAGPTTSNRTINLGLERIEKAIPPKPTWIGIHVGGTNGKGSIIAYLAALFKLAGISHGTYTSPAFPERHNSVSINGLYCNKRLYEMERSRMPKIQKKANWWAFNPPEDESAWYDQLTPFEKDTAAAFRVFDRMRVKYGIVEVGMGGATDATNAMIQKSLTIIGKIGLDHQEYLGNTVEEIAKVKAGIMRIGVPCIVDATNSDSVLQVLKAHAQEVRTTIIPSTAPQADSIMDKVDRSRYPLEPYQETNLRCAMLAFQYLFPDKPLDINSLLELDPKMPGRTEWVDAQELTGDDHSGQILVDGAHNMLGIEALVGYVNRHIRTTPLADASSGLPPGPVTWIMSQSSSPSKPFVEMIQALIRPDDHFAFVEYDPKENEPNSARAALAVDVARTCVNDDGQVYDGPPKVSEAIRWAASKNPKNPIIVTGSLYLIRELYALEEIKCGKRTGERKPGRSQLWRLTREAQQRQLTEQEEKEYNRARQHWYYHAVRNPLFSELAEEKETDLSEEEAAKLAEDMEKRERLIGSLQDQLDQLKYNIVLESHGLRDKEDHVWDNIFPEIDDDRPYEERLRASGLSHEQVLYKRRLADMTMKELYEEQTKVLAEWEHHREEYNRNAYRTRTPGKKWLSYEEVFGVTPRWPRAVGATNTYEHNLNPIDDLDAYIETRHAARGEDIRLQRDPEAWIEDWGEEDKDDDDETHRSGSKMTPRRRRMLSRKELIRDVMVEEWGYEDGQEAHPVVDKMGTGRRLDIKDEVAQRRRVRNRRPDYRVGDPSDPREFLGEAKGWQWVSPDELERLAGTDKDMQRVGNKEWQKENEDDDEVKMEDLEDLDKEVDERKGRGQVLIICPVFCNYTMWIYIQM